MFKEKFSLTLLSLIIIFLITNSTSTYAIQNLYNKRIQNVIFSSQDGEEITGHLLTLTKPVFEKPMLWRSFENFINFGKDGTLILRIVTSPPNYDVRKYKTDIILIDSENKEENTSCSDDPPRFNDDLKIVFDNKPVYTDYPFQIDDDDDEFFQTDIINNGKRYRQITLQVEKQPHSIEIYANAETAIYEIGFNFLASLTLPSGWCRGNTHVHSRNVEDCSLHQPRSHSQMAYGGTNCSGSPQDGYEDKNYDFMYVTAHNARYDPRNLSDKNLPFYLFRGEEAGVTEPTEPHVNGLGILSKVYQDSSQNSNLNKINYYVQQIENQNTTQNPTEATLNHPKAERVDDEALLNCNAYHLEVLNGDDSSSDSYYRKRWKKALNNSKYYCAIAADDAHTYSDISKTTIVVKSDISGLDSADAEKEITQALRDARTDPTKYYATKNKLVIEDYQILSNPLRLRVEVDTSNDNADRIVFKGTKNGTYYSQLLKVNNGDSADLCSGSKICAEYQIQSDVDWVRPFIRNSDASKKAWLQPWAQWVHGQ